LVVKPTGTSCPRAKTKLYVERNDSHSKYETEHELADLRVECTNKDKTIREHEKQIEDIKLELQCLNDKYKTLQNEHSQIEKQHQKEIESMVMITFN
jgi:molecular chaperone GrpE (heat shock protein)